MRPNEGKWKGEAGRSELAVGRDRQLTVMSTMKTNVLLSSIFFMADSVVSGCLMILNLSILLKEGAEVFSTAGFEAILKVFGLGGALERTRRA